MAHRVTEQDIRTLLSRNIKRFRNKQNLSQLALANLAGLTHNFINDIENGRKWVSPKTVAKLATILGVEPFQFFLSETTKDNIDSEIFTGYLEEFADSFDKLVHDFRSHYSPEPKDKDTV